MLLLEKDLAGKQSTYLSSEDDFQFLKSLEARNLVIPVVGNLAGSHALREIGKVMAERGDKLSALYVSNVEFYLMREATFDTFAATVRTLPHDSKSAIVRSYFGGGFYGPHPQSVPGYFSTQYAKLRAVTAADVKRVANKYLTGNRVVLSIVPQGQRAQASKADAAVAVTVSPDGGHYIMESK
jgi:hypothetical protein